MFYSSVQAGKPEKLINNIIGIENDHHSRWNEAIISAHNKERVYCYI